MPGGGKVSPMETTLIENEEQLELTHTEVAQRVTSAGAAPMPPCENEEDLELSYWIPRHIQRRECCSFVEKPPKSGKPSELPEGQRVCYCGRIKKEHKSEAQESSVPGKWTVHSHTKQLPTNAFGELEFKMFNDRTGKYVRVAGDTDMKTMTQLLMEKWGLELPNLLISVTGGAKNFTMKPRLKEVFRRGLVKAAQSTGAWIITGGMNAGVMKHVGEAVLDYTVAAGSRQKLVTIGIATWGCVAAKEQLTDSVTGDKKSEGFWPAMYKPLKVERSAPLDPNHTHFILVDQGTEFIYGEEIDFRAALENEITKQENQEGTAIPIVLVVVEGGPGTIHTVHSAITNGTPAVIVDGSGRAADIFAFAYKYSREVVVPVVDQHSNKKLQTITVIDEFTDQKITEMVREEFGENNLVQNATWIKESLIHRDLVTVFTIDQRESAKDIDVAILRALLKANRNETLTQLRLALAWNRIDVAESDIFTEDYKLDQCGFNQVMQTAVLAGKVKFINLFLDSGINLQDFLTMDRLEEIYDGIPPNSFLNVLIDKFRDPNRRGLGVNLQDIAEVIQELMGDSYCPLYTRDSRYYGYVDENKDAPTTRRQSIVENHVGASSQPDGGLEQNHMYFDVPARELFIFAVLMNREDMSKLFWERLEEPIGAALTAAQMLQSMQQHTEDTELQEKLRKHGQYYEEIACGVLNECHLSDEARASQELLIRELPNYGNSTCLQLAVEGDNKTFISHACTQSLLNQIWMGKMSHKNKLWRIWMSIIFPPFLLFLIYFREDETSRFANKNKNRKDKSKRLTREQTVVSTRKKSTDPASSSQGDEGLDIRNTGRKLTWYDRIRFFYNAPLTTFLHNCISYLCFLLLFSYILLIDFNPAISVPEMVLMVWVLTLFVEEVRQLLADDASVFRLKIMSYIYDAWNVVDVVTLVFFLTGTILRLIQNCPNCFEAARIIFALNLMTFWFRILHIFSVQKTLGPMLVMIGRMVLDLLGFFVILMVFVLAYGLASQAILYPNSDLNPLIIIDVLSKPYWQMYGELFLEEIGGTADCVTETNENTTLPICPSEVGTWVAPVLLGFYILFTNILMFNLLIAMFSYTFQRVQAQADVVWKFQRYTLAYEYFRRPPLAPPFIIITHVALLIEWILRCCGCRGKNDHQNLFKWRIKDEGVSKRLNKWEFMNGEEFIRRRSNLEKATMEMQVKDSKIKIDDVSVSVEALKEELLGMRSKQQAMANKAPSYLEERFTSIEEQLDTTFQALNWIVQNMSGQAKGAPPKLQDPKQKKVEEEERKNDLAKKEKERYMMMLSEQNRLHVNSRWSPYPEAGHDMRRFEVPDEKVPWNVPFPEYSPVEYTSPVVLEGPNWADPDLIHSKPDQALNFNNYDMDYMWNRKSLETQPYRLDERGLPLNPRGRTGMVGRGLLGRWGPNFCGDPVVTRWKVGEDGKVATEDGLKLLEFIAVQRKDGIREWAIPGGIIQPGQNVLDCIRVEFTEDVMGEEADQVSDQTKQKLDQLLQKGQTVYTGYADDPRNTDNAWLETTAVNYHDEAGKILECLKFKAGSSVHSVAWQPVSSKIQLYGGHLNILRKLALSKNAAF